MTRLTASSSAALCALCTLGCGVTVTPHASPCIDDTSCLDGQVCQAGTCVEASFASCSSDLQCDVSQGQVCSDGTCTAPPSVAPATCGDTRDCPLDTFCNDASHACEPLLDGWCRVPSQCGGSTPACATDTPARPATCVECTTSSDCAAGGSCSDNVCSGGDAAAVTCPANASLVPGSTTVCQCDDGFVPNTATASCDAAPAAGGGDITECVPNASLIPGTTQCKCNGGFVPNSDGSACVPSGSSSPPPPSGGTTPPPPSSGGGVSGGGSSGSTCGPNAIDLFFVCVCEPGFVVNPAGPGCIADTGTGGSGGTSTPPTTVPDDGCPAHASPDPSDATLCDCDPGFVVDGSGAQCVADTASTGDGCPANSSPDPTDSTLCDCDPGFVVNSSGAACVVDTSSQDGGCPANSSPDPADSTLCDCDPGFVVDSSGTACVVDTSQTQCPANSSPDAGDPSLCDCDPGFVVDSSGTQCVEDVCAANGFYGDGICDTFCPFADPDCG